VGSTQPADRLGEDQIGDLTLPIAHWKRYQGVEICLRAEIDGPDEWPADDAVPHRRLVGPRDSRRLAHKRNE